MKSYPIYIFITIVAYSCNIKSNKTLSKEQIIQDSLRIDSLRQNQCSLILKFISETNSGKINLPNIHPIDIAESIIQLDTCTNDTIKEWVKCTTQDEYVSTLHHGFGMHLRNTWGLWAESELAKKFNSLGIYHPDDMSSIILRCFHQYVNTGNYSINDKVEYYKAYWEKLKEKSDSTLQAISINRNKAQKFVDSLHNKIDYEKKLKQVNGLMNDSLNFYIEQKRGDTIIFLLPNSYFTSTFDEYLEISKSKKFGNEIFFGGIMDDGTISHFNLRPERFIKRNGILLYEEESGGFVKVLTKDMLKNPNIIYEWKAISNCAFNKSFIKIQWKLNGKNFYALEMRGDCKGTGLKVGYFIDEDLNVIFDENIKRKLWKCKKIFENNHT